MITGSRTVIAPMVRPPTRPPKTKTLRLRLYITGNVSASRRAIANARAVCVEHFGDGHWLEIVDLETEPLRGITDGIVVTPTLLKLMPLPARQLVGDLSDADQLLVTLRDG